jgi:2-desacetyl-2-hydroxyethyl bacteriochlorophyllide A dehydrogenase
MLATTQERKQILNPDYFPATMQAAVLYGPRDLRLERVNLPDLAAGEVLVKVEAVALCGSDLHFYTGERALKEPMVLGHEITGRVVATGPDVAVERLNDRVAIEPNIPCGVCNRCLRGLGRICQHKQSVAITRWGGLAEYIAVPTDFAWTIPETFSLADAATIEPTAVVIHALRQAQIKPGSTLAVVGCGGVGLLLAITAIAQGYRVVVIEPNPKRRQAALSAGVTQAIATRDAGEAHTFFEQFDVQYIFECAGIAVTTQLCLDAAPSGSRIILLGLSAENVTFNPLRFVRNDLEVRSSLIYDHPVDFAATLELIASGRLKPGSTTGQPQPLENVEMLLQAMEEGALDAKPIIIFPNPT